MQRVAVARALGGRPVILLADEPTGNLDSSGGAAVLELLKAAPREHGCALVMVTHDLKAANTADRVVEYRDGKFVGEIVHRGGQSSRQRGTCGGSSLTCVISCV